MSHFAEARSFFDDDVQAIAPVIDRATPHISVHRKHLRDRFAMGGGPAMLDCELLELILVRAIPRHDVRAICIDLLEQFGDFNRVVSAPLHRLLKVSGVTEAAALEIKMIEAAAHRLSRAKILQRPIVSSWDALIDYCHTIMAHRDTEQLRVLYLDTKNTLIADETQANGTIDHVPVYPREVVKRALDLNAAAIILVHNHPSGDPTPSQSDITMTQQIADAVKPLRITLHDHLIIGQSREFSFRAQGLL
ncbi:DNA repair protein RadC [Loktanella ponticola]|uniref:DNA repair protein RadC n=1 Tax=Yoonia ponticola TaxID=1524255 RepID=A0A7W9BJ32_9RHOB|nr:DNA repair protein RadC [Yoonia ponticola]MBB5721370.1 DNA repair protein RadC [Yoonia ponticola]